MFDKNLPRIIVAGLRGGGGKTILSLSIIAALRNKGLKTVPFKKGPDYIDAGWMARAAGMPCYNLDLFMMTPDQACRSFISHTTDAEIAVIEGNRGLYDGVDHEGTYSTAELAKLLKTPVILAVDCTKVTNTVSALILGCQQMDPAVSVGAVVLNRVATGRQENVIRRSITKNCNVPVLGAIPRLRKDPFPERHMGLTPFQEHEGLGDSIEAVKEIGEKYLDIEGIISIAEKAGAVPALNMDNEDPVRARHALPLLKIGVIRDSAFQFYYQENIDELEKRGVNIVEVSPLSEDRVPDIDALYIGGGFPETHAIALAENSGFKESLRQAIEKGLPVYAECGGLMYLGKSITLSERTYPMVGVLPVSFGMEKRPSAHGYTIADVERENPFYATGTVLKGHEFHYSRVLDVQPDENISFAFTMKRGRGIVENKDGICYKNVLAAYTHLHAIGSPEWADGMVKCAVRFKEKRRSADYTD